MWNLRDKKKDEEEEEAHCCRKSIRDQPKEQMRGVDRHSGSLSFLFYQKKFEEINNGESNSSASSSSYQTAVYVVDRECIEKRKKRNKY